MNQDVPNVSLEKPKVVDDEVINSFLCYKTTQKNFFIFFSTFNFVWTFSVISGLTYLFYRVPKLHIEMILYIISLVFFVINLMSIWSFLKHKNYGYSINKLCAIKGMVISSLFASVLGLLLMFIVIGSIIIPGKDKVGRSSLRLK